MITESTVALSFYKELTPINEEHKVYLVRHVETCKIYIKKVLSIYNEAVYNAIKENSIPGIPAIHELIKDSGELIVIEEYISGKTLDEMLSQNVIFTKEQIVNIALGLCEILGKLHSFNPPIIHRDIKPSNVIMTSDNRIFLLDLNAAKNEDTEKGRDTKLLGTFGYAAPEQYGFGSSTVQSDIYSMGVLINTLAHGKFSIETTDIPEINSIVDKCLKLNPSERYKNIAELKSDLSKTLPKYKAEKSVIENKPRFLDFLPPGFRNLNLLHMFCAIAGYVMIFQLFFEVDFPSYGSKITSLPINFILLIGILVFIFFNANYLGIQRFLPLCKSTNIFIRFFGVLIFDIAIIGLVAVFLVAYTLIFRLFNGIPL
ncbi:MAG: serine/threonine protein kinase [Lachnospiraceae bacterium]|nr:serine/threonine protein kinase [Lachnospiraceae bacterium]